MYYWWSWFPDYEHMSKVLHRCWWYVGVMLLVEQQNWIDPILMYRETHRQLGYWYFIMCQVLPLLVRLHHKTYEHSDTIWMWQGYQTLCPWQGNYKDDRCSSGWYFDVLHDVVVGIATPAMERYTLGSRSIIMVSVIVWPDTWLSCYVTGTSIIWMSKTVHAG